MKVPRVHKQTLKTSVCDCFSRIGQSLAKCLNSLATVTMGCDEIAFLVNSHGEASIRVISC